MSIEHCDDCGQATGNAGEGEDSIFIYFPERKVGPLCSECRTKHYVCEKCGEGVWPSMVSLVKPKVHLGCGGICSKGIFE